MAVTPADIAGTVAAKKKECDNTGSGNSHVQSHFPSLSTGFRKFGIIVAS
jgi:hypothetical protein